MYLYSQTRLTFLLQPAALNISVHCHCENRVMTPWEWCIFGSHGDGCAWCRSLHRIAMPNTDTAHNKPSGIGWYCTRLKYDHISNMAYWPQIRRLRSPEKKHNFPFFVIVKRLQFNFPWILICLIAVRLIKWRGRSCKSLNLSTGQNSFTLKI